MTRHNLDVHIPWLLASGANSPTFVRGSAVRESAARTNFGVADAQEGGEDFGSSRTAPSPSRNTRIERTANVVQSSPRPQVPSSNFTLQPSRVITNPPADEAMGKLTSSSKPSRPGKLLSQHQLATPASTSGSMAAPSSLMHNYSSFLRKGPKGMRAIHSILQP